jgi:hypothetical protein
MLYMANIHRRIFLIDYNLFIIYVIIYIFMLYMANIHRRIFLQVGFIKTSQSPYTIMTS